MPCAEQSFTKIAKTQFIIYARMISKLYTIISNKLWDLSLYFGNRYNRWVLSSQQTALRSYKCARFRAKQTYRNYNFRYLLTFVSVEESFSYTRLYLINYEIHPFILGIVITDGSLQVSKQLWGLVNSRDFERSKHIKILVFAICWLLSALKSPSHEKKHFLKNS